MQQAVSLEEFAQNILLYRDMAKSRAVTVNDSDGVTFSFVLKRKKVKAEPQPGVWIPTAEDLAEIREAEEERAKGHYYAQRDDETVDEFIDRMLLEDD